MEAENNLSVIFQIYKEKPNYRNLDKIRENIHNEVKPEEVNYLIKEGGITTLLKILEENINKPDYINQVCLKFKFLKRILNIIKDNNFENLFNSY